MAMLKFNRGLYSVLKDKAIVNGNVYITTDEKAMYVDIDDQRIRLGQIVCLTQAEWEVLPPPYSPDAFYYLTDANAMLKYTNGAWKQINGTQDLKDRIGALETKVSGENGLETKVTTLANDLDALEETIAGIVNTGGEKNKINTIKVNGTALTPDADRAVNIVLGDLADLDKVDADHLDDALKTRLTNIEDKNTSQDNRLNTAEGTIITHGQDIEQLKTDVATAQDQANKGVADAATAKAQADKGVADAATAQQTANAAATAVTGLSNELNSVKDTYATKTALNGVKEALEASIDTVDKKLPAMVEATAAAKSVADAAKVAAANAQDDVDELTEEVTALKNSIGDLANIMNFRGVVEVFSDVENPEDGDVIIIGEKEYVYFNKDWHEYGDASGNADAITKLTARVAENEGDIAALEATVNGTENADGLVKKVADNAEDITTLNNTIKAMYTDEEINDLLSWGKF